MFVQARVCACAYLHACVCAYVCVYVWGCLDVGVVVNIRVRTCARSHGFVCVCVIECVVCVSAYMHCVCLSCVFYYYV